MVALAVEPWAAIRSTILPLWEKHNAEITAVSDRPLFDPDWDRYDQVADKGKAHWVTARDDSVFAARGNLVGYAFAIVDTHMHRNHTLSAFYDLYYLLPDYRRGWNGKWLLDFMEQSLWALGVRKQYAGTKFWKDVGVIFERHGWVETERLYTKSLDD